MPDATSVRPLVAAAWLNIVLHVAGLAFAVVGMRPGTPVVPLSQRLEYLAQSPPAWCLGWAVWMLCAVALIGFLAAVALRLGAAAPLAQIGLMFAIAGAAFDLLCDAIYILVFPQIASWQPPPERMFLAIERITGIASMVIANGFYSVGVFMTTQALRGRKDLARYTVSPGYAVTGFGLLLAGAGFTGVAWHAEWATGPTIAGFCLWVLLVAYSLESAGAPA